MVVTTGLTGTSSVWKRDAWWRRCPSLDLHQDTDLHTQTQICILRQSYMRFLFVLGESAMPLIELISQNQIKNGRLTFQGVHSNWEVNIVKSGVTLHTSFCGASRWYIESVILITNKRKSSPLSAKHIEIKSEEIMPPFKR